MNDPKSPNMPGAKPPLTPGSGSDTASAAKIAGGGSLGTAGQPSKPQDHAPQGSTLASHTSKPMGGTGTGTGRGGTTGTGAGMGGTAGTGMGTQSRGPEHLRHQDKDAGQGLGQQGRAAGESLRQSAGSAADTAAQAAKSATDTLSDVAGQAQERAGELYEQASERAGEFYEQASGWARDAYEQGSRYYNEMPSVGIRGSSVERFVRENPVLVGVVGLAAGLLLGALIPRTRQEDRTLGPWSDELRDQGMRYAREMTHRGREFVDEAFGEGDPRFASHESEARRGGGPRPGPSGRHQNH